MLYDCVFWGINWKRCRSPQVSVNYRLQAILIKDQRKAFNSEIILETSCARIETVGKENLMTSRNGNRTIMQSVRIKHRPSSRIRMWNQLSQFRLTSTKFDTSRKYFKLAKFWRWAKRVPERQPVKEQQSYISIFVFFSNICQ